MWVENVLGIPVWGWILIALFGAGFVALCLLCWRSRKEPHEEHLDYFCRCYARGEITKEDFEELKEDLNHYSRSINKENEKNYGEETPRNRTIFKP